MIEKRCTNCADCESREPIYSGGETTYKCRRSPPTFNPPDHTGVWPGVYPTDWCGAWRPSAEVRDQTMKEEVEAAQRAMHEAMRQHRDEQVSEMAREGMTVPGEDDV